MAKKKTTTIQIYPACPKPPWLKVGAEVEVLGEGRGCPFRITAIEGNRAAVVAKKYYRKGHKGGCWESFTKIYRPGHFDEDYAFTHEQLALPGTTAVPKAKKMKTTKTSRDGAKVGLLRPAAIPGSKPKPSPPTTRAERAKLKRYYYSIMTLADALPSHQVFVPNCSPEEAIQIWRWLSGHRNDFPKFWDHSILIHGIDEEAWCAPKVYAQAFAPSEMTCIVRSETR